MVDIDELKRLAQEAVNDIARYGDDAYWDPRMGLSDIEAAYAEAANPAAVLELIEEVERNDARWIHYTGQMSKALGEVEALRKDAERYRWLRDECPRNWDVMYRDVEILIEEPQADDCENLDGIIDAAMAAKEGE